MKKLLLSALSVLTCVALTTPVFAQGSVGTPTGSVTDGCESNCELVITDENSNEDLKNDANNYANKNSLGEYNLIGLYNISLQSDAETSGNLTIKFNVSGLQSGYDVVVLHRVMGKGWEKVNSSVSGSTVTVSGLSSLSPFAIFTRKVESTTTEKEVGGWDDGGPFTTDECGNVFDRWGNEIYHAPSCVVNGDSNTGYNFVNTADR